MNFIDNTSVKKSNIEIFLLNVLLLLYLFRSAIPLFKYPFILLFLCYFLYTIIFYRNNLIDYLKEFFNNYFWALILVGILFLAILFSSKIYLTVLKEVVEILITLSLFFILTIVISSKKRLDLFVSNLLFQILIFALFIAIINTHVFVGLQNYAGFYPIHNFQNQAFYNSLLLDTNFALLPEFFGIIILFYKMNRSVSKLRLIIFNLLLLVYSFNIILSPSRRGLIVLLFIIIFLFLSLITTFIFRSKYLIFKRLIANLGIFYIALLIIPLGIVMFFRSDSYTFKVETLNFFGVKDITASKRVVTSTIYSGLFRFNRVLSYPELNKKLWSTSFDPKDPDNGWGLGYYKTIFPLKGKNFELVPKGSIGYLLDKSCTFSNSASHAYSNTFIGKARVAAHNLVNASVYCFVSSDFNGDMVCLRADGTTFGDRVSSYDLKSKGSWQKLSISASCNPGDAPVALYFNKQEVTDFSSLTGYVIFAYPQYEILNNIENTLSLNNFFMKSKSDTEFTYYKSDFPYNVSDYPNNVSDHPDYREMHVPISSNFKHEYYSERGGLTIQSSIIDLENFPVYNVTLFLSSLTFTSSMDSINKDPDIFRNWIKNLFRVDTSYYDTSTKLKVDTISKFFVDDRLSRWEFAIQIFTKEYSWSKRIFGGGFKFLNWYGYNFLNDRTKTDYPHNPILYILLYSGLVGLSIYFFFLYKTFYYYIRYIKKYPSFFFFFLITFYFTFFSGGNPFDPPIMGFFIILPFFLHSVHKKELILNNNSDLKNE